MKYINRIIKTPVIQNPFSETSPEKARERVHAVNVSRLRMGTPKEEEAINAQLARYLGFFQ